MKKTALILITLFMSIGAFAQFQSGNILLSGTLIFNASQSENTNGSTTTKGPKTTTFELGPAIEYFVTNKISIGGEIDFTNEKTDNKNPGGGNIETIDRTNMTTISPYASMYFINEERFALFCKLGIGFGFGKTKNEVITGNTTVTNTANISSFEIGIKPGVAVHLSEKFGMTATIGMLGYSSYKTDDGNNEFKNTSYGLRLSPSLGFGIFFKLK